MEGIALDSQLAKMLSTSAELGAMKALKEVGQIKPYMSKFEAGKIYGRTAVDNWIKSGALTVRQEDIGKTIRLDRLELATIAASQSLVQYLNYKKNGK